MDNKRALKKAKLRTGAKLGFYLHGAVFVTVIVMLAIINFATSSQYLWFLWVLMAWGVGIIFHGLAVFLFASGSTDKMIADELSKIQEQK